MTSPFASFWPSRSTLWCIRPNTFLSSVIVAASPLLINGWLAALKPRGADGPYWATANTELRSKDCPSRTTSLPPSVSSRNWRKDDKEDAVYDCFLPWRIEFLRRDILSTVGIEGSPILLEFVEACDYTKYSLWIWAMIRACFCEIFKEPEDVSWIT